MENPGLSPEVQQALARRMGQPPVAPTIGQVSPQAAMQNQVMQPMNPSEVNAASSPPNVSPNQTSQKFEPTDRKDLIVQALVSQLENENKAEKQQAQLGAAMGGGNPYPMTKPMGGGFSMSPGYEQPMPISQMQGDYQNGMGRDYSGMGNYGQKEQKW